MCRDLRLVALKICSIHSSTINCKNEKKKRTHKKNKNTKIFYKKLQLFLIGFFLHIKNINKKKKIGRIYQSLEGGKQQKRKEEIMEEKLSDLKERKEKEKKLSYFCDY